MSFIFRLRKIEFILITMPPHLAAHLTENLLDWSRHWGNPSSIHMSGRGPKALIRQARDQVAKMIGAHTLEIIFTSGEVRPIICV